MHYPLNDYTAMSKIFICGTYTKKQFNHGLV
jgi:hypothetical protein